MPNYLENPIITYDRVKRAEVLHIPLSKKKGYAKINVEDYKRLVALGYVGTWFLNDGYVSVSFKNINRSVANVLFGSPRGKVVSYRNLDRLDLRHSNLYLRTRKDALEVNRKSASHV